MLHIFHKSNFPKEPFALATPLLKNVSGLTLPRLNYELLNLANQKSLPSLYFPSLCEVAQSYPTLCNPMDCSLSGSSIHGIFQARVLEWIAISFSRGSPQARNRTRVSRIAGKRFTVWATRETLFPLWVFTKTQYFGQVGFAAWTTNTPVLLYPASLFLSSSLHPCLKKHFCWSTVPL